jgi:hypothetical protein
MVGPLYNLTNVPRRPNLHWLGYKRFELLPNYTQLFDAAIIPFRVSQMTEAVNPIKMWEYMAAGTPVVTTALPEARGIPEIYCSENDDQFIANIRQALNEDPHQFRQARISLAQRNTWLARAQQILQSIERTMGSVRRLSNIPISGFRHAPLEFASSPVFRRGNRIVIRVRSINSGIREMPPITERFRRFGTSLNYGKFTMVIKKPLVISV